MPTPSTLPSSEPLWVMAGGNTQGSCRCLSKGTPTDSVFSCRRQVAALEVQDRATLHLAAETSPGSADQFRTTPLTSHPSSWSSYTKGAPGCKGQGSDRKEHTDEHEGSVTRQGKEVNAYNNQCQDIWYAPLLTIFKTDVEMKQEFFFPSLFIINLCICTVQMGR